MATNPKNNRINQQADDQQLIAGLQKHAATVTSLVINGVPHDNASVVAVLKERIDARAATVTTKAAWQAAVQAAKDESTKTDPFVGGLRQTLKVAFAGSIDTLADFGLRPRKVPVRTPDQKMAAIAKAKATRAARHTMGPKQKAQITGASVAAAHDASMPSAQPTAPTAASVPAAALAPAAASAPTATPAAVPAPASASPAAAPGATTGHTS